MKRALEISKQRDLLKQEINVLIENTLPARILQTAGSLIQRLTRRPNLPPWYINTILLGIIAIFPQFLAALILWDSNQIIGNELLWSITTEAMVLVIPAVYLLLKYILTIIHDHIVNDIEENDNLIKLQEFLLELRKLPRSMTVVLLVSIIWSSVVLPLLSTVFSINLGVFLAVVVGNIALGLILFFMSWYMQFPSQFQNYQYKLYKLDPAKSEVISHISNLLTVPFFAGAIFQATLILVLSFFKDQFKVRTVTDIPWLLITFVFFPLFVVWLPLIVHFINSQIAINKIINTAKWHVLAEIQHEIDQQYTTPKLQLTQNIETINKLMDLYERLYNTYNSKLAATRILSFLNQLILPLIASLISNYKDIINLFSQP